MHAARDKAIEKKRMCLREFGITDVFENGVSG
jgi:hypothetical protein